MKVEYDYEYYWTIEPEWVEYSSLGAVHHNAPLHLGPQGISPYQSGIKIVPNPDEDSLYMIQDGSRYEVIRVKAVFHNNVCQVERAVLGTSALAFSAFSTVYPIRINRTTRTARLVRTNDQAA